MPEDRMSDHGVAPMRTKLNNVPIAILATNGFEQSELITPKKALEEVGAEVVVVSPESGEIRGWDHTDWGRSVKVDRALDEARAGDFAALVLPGGQINPDLLRVNEKAVAFVKAFAEADKPIAAICHGPWVLIEAELVKGRKMTSYPSIRTDMINAGANWVDEEVVTDGRFVTSRKPDDLDAFCRATIDMVAETSEARAA